MTQLVDLKRALISVSDKTGLLELGKALRRLALRSEIPRIKKGAHWAPFLWCPKFDATRCFVMH